MGIYDFNILSEHDQYDTVFTKGQFVDKESWLKTLTTPPMADKG